MGKEMLKVVKLKMTLIHGDKTSGKISLITTVAFKLKMRKRSRKRRKKSLRKKKNMRLWLLRRHQLAPSIL